MVCPSNLTTATAFLLYLAILLNLVSAHNFSELFQCNWAPDHFVDEGDQIKLTLDTASGSGFGSKRKYLFGKASVQIKLVEGDSAGTVTAFYMSSDGPNHDELDFEFLGNLSSEPYLVQTNVYVNGTGNREQRHTLWFDPTIDFHTYTLLWNHYYIMFLVDGVPLRVFANKEEATSVLYPKNQAMGIYGSLWNADDWATQGGMVKTNWSYSPFVSTFQSFKVDACEFSPENGTVIGKCSKVSQYRWDKSAMNGLSKHKEEQLRRVRENHLVYDYCEDTVRFPEPPKECLN
ncbi:xyloglucan endotransglucosylase/hydrolase protein 9-like [Telopea speciosissima]|uniref:xyloglucan endotransglucosylase/hydrolase protein 9-like n=1 Tax=Telopea speciosissima TaxID=54955 RepID=UPI001CC55D71|nr:xyloglucan endotransglucosylase/hydrolase protein 9-like [Telopea speciosissima]